MANMLGHADKRTEQQRHDDAITGRDDLTPTALNNNSIRKILEIFIDA